jgi:spore coat protein CotH
MLILWFVLYKIYFELAGDFMFAVIYQFKLKPKQETEYVECWNKVATYFMNKRGAIGSCLHKSDDNLWVAYSRWPSKEARDASWPGNEAPNEELPLDIIEAIAQIQRIKEENSDLEQFDEICMHVVEDKLLTS